MITKKHIAAKLAAYLDHEIPLAALVDWSEREFMDGEFAAADAEVIARSLARLGLADVREFGLTWEDCHDLLKDLGYSAVVKLVAV